MRDGHCVMLKKRIKRKSKVKKKKNGGDGRSVHRKREIEKRVREKNFSLRSTKIGPYVFVGVRGKVNPRIESYTWVPKSWSFIKLHEVENFPTWVISNVKVI